MDSISNHNAAEWDYYTIMPVVGFLTLLCFYKDKQELEAATIKAINDGD